MRGGQFWEPIEKGNRALVLVRSSEDPQTRRSPAHRSGYTDDVSCSRASTAHDTRRPGIAENGD